MFLLVMKLTFKAMFGNFSSWGLLWYLVLIAFILPSALKRGSVERRIEWYLGILPVVYYFLVITPIYVFWQPLQGHPIEAEFDGMSFERFRFPCLALIALFTSLRISGFLTRAGILKVGA